MNDQIHFPLIVMEDNKKKLQDMADISLGDLHFRLPAPPFTIPLLSHLINLFCGELPKIDVGWNTSADERLLESELESQKWLCLKQLPSFRQVDFNV